MPIAVKNMGWSEPEIMCKKHPDHRQQPGVCSACLREKLSKLPSFTFTMVPHSQASSGSLLSSPLDVDNCRSSAPPSTCMSPISTKNAHHPRRNSSVIAGSNNCGRNGLRKSKSIAYVGRRRVRNIGVEGKKKEGFWSKLIRSTSVKTKAVFVHSSKTQ